MDVSVSVIVPAFNAGTSLQRCLDSILTQMDDRMELIVVDDGSSDGTFRHLAERLEGNGAIRLVRSTENHGPAYARNTGIRLSRGRLIAFCDADHEYLPGKLAAQTASLEAHPDADFVFAADRNIADDDSPGTMRVFRMAERDRRFHFRTALFRREVFDRVGLMDESMRRSEDVEWVARALSAGCRYEEISEPLYLRHVLSSGLTASVSLSDDNRAGRRMDAFSRGIHHKAGFRNGSDVELSILIPCLNAARYLAEALGSCRTTHAAEIIVVDDGSTDGSPEAALQALERSGIPGTVVRRAHKGQAASRNDALALARGAWILFLDADDRFTADALDQAMALAGTAAADTALISFRCRELRIEPLDEASRDIVEIDGEIEGRLPVSVKVDGRLLNVLSANAQARR